MPIADPRDIPDLICWYSAEHEAASVADGALMSGGLTDLSGNGNHATHVVGTGDGPYMRHTSGPGGGAAFESMGQGTSGVGYFALPAAPFSTPSALEAMFVVRAENTGNNGWGQMEVWTSQHNHYAHSGLIYDQFFSDSRKQFAPGVSITDWRRYNTWSAANDWGARLDGVTVATTTSNTIERPTNPRLTAGNAGATEVRFRGFISCVVIYGRKLTTTERDDLDAWLVANPTGGTPAAVSLVGEGLLSATGRRRVRGSVGLVGASALSASGHTPGLVIGAASLVGNSVLAASGGPPAVTVTGSVSLVGEGVMEASQYGVYDPPRHLIGLRFGSSNANDVPVPVDADDVVVYKRLAMSGE